MAGSGDSAWWSEQLCAHWTLGDPGGLDLPVVALDGEYDLNFRVGDVAILKVMRVGCDPAFVDMQAAALQHVTQEHGEADETKTSCAQCLPEVLPARNGDTCVLLEAPDGTRRCAWLISALPGKPYAEIKPQSRGLIREIGRALRHVDDRLATFDHPFLDRDIKWDLCRPLWARAHLALIGSEDRRAQLAEIMDRFERDCAHQLPSLPQQAIHNDLNDYNILCRTHADGRQELTGVLDFGDMVRGPVVCDLAIAGAYIVLDQARPVEALADLVSGYGDRIISEDEVALIWPLVLTRLAVSALNAADMWRQDPDDPYVTISQAPIERFFSNVSGVNEAYVLARLRLAAGYEPVQGAPSVAEHLLLHAERMAPVFAEDLSRATVLDLSVAGADAPQNPVVLDGPELTTRVDACMTNGHAALGRYGEPRLIYTEPGFFAGDHPATDRRTVHMAIDVFLSAGTSVHAPLAGTVHSVDVCPEHLGYGGVLVLRHETDGKVPFFSLYGHLAHDVVARHQLGDVIAAGDEIALLGAEEENGGWAPHVHLQLGLFDLPGPEWPGVVDPDEWTVWRTLCPDPAVLLGFSAGHATAPELDVQGLRERRAAGSAANLKLSYREPVAILRGWQSYLFDDRGRPYLDAYNNVPHVGHAHPRITDAVARQIRLVNTNTRYLQPVHEAYTEALCARLPDPLNVCFLLSSASEANEVAVRLARAFTGATDVIVMADGYHGHTNTALDLSDYKFSGPGGGGKKNWVHVVPNPDTYRGAWRAGDPIAGDKFSGVVGDVTDRMKAEGRRLAAFISEVFPSVGGQIVPPPGYLKAAYAHVRAAGGVCIADEVQTGLGRLGTHEWAFVQQGAVPDIVVLGKPIGNGYPLAAVITTREIADAFANGMEFFSTFGGSSVSCAAGHEVLRILDDEGLADNAARVGAYVLDGLRGLQSTVSAIGDVRGMGFFIGVEMIESDGTHSQRKAAYVVNRLRERRILIGSDGPMDNVLKIRPPLCFTRGDADYFLDAIGAILMEDVIQNA